MQDAAVSDGDDVPIPQAPDVEQVEEPVKPKRDNARVKKLTDSLCSEYKRMSFYGHPLLPDAKELRMMLRPGLNLLDRYGLLAEDAVDSPIYDILLLMLGVTFYGIRISATIKLARAAAELQRTVPADAAAKVAHPIHRGQAPAPDGGNVGADDSAISGAETYAAANAAIDRILEQDFNGRVEQGLL